MRAVAARSGVRLAGRRGLVHARFGGEGRCHVRLHARGVGQPEEFKLAHIPRADDPPRPFIIQATQGIQFCPHCGSNLRYALGSSRSRDGCGSTLDHIGGCEVTTALRGRGLIAVLDLAWLAVPSLRLNSS